MCLGVLANSLMNVHAGYTLAIKSYQTYTKHNPATGETYTGRTSGEGTTRK